MGSGSWSGSVTRWAQHIGDQFHITDGQSMLKTKANLEPTHYLLKADVRMLNVDGGTHVASISFQRPQRVR